MDSLGKRLLCLEKGLQSNKPHRGFLTLLMLGCNMKRNLICAKESEGAWETFPPVAQVMDVRLGLG